MTFDRNFLDEVGLSNLPEEQKDAFLKQAQDELEMRVGERVSKGLTTEQVEEFEGIMNNDQQVIRRVVSQLGTDFRTDPIYQKLLERHGVTEGTWEIIGEYLSVKWIMKNRPNYREIVEQTKEELKQEIRAQVPQILGTQN